MSGVLKSASSSPIKEDGILLTEQDVVFLRQDRIDKWLGNQIWSLKYGNEMLAASNIFTNFSMNQFYRKQFHLQKSRNSLGILASILTTTILPTAGAAAVLQTYFTINLLRADKTECSLCHELKGIGLHMGIGTILPTLVSWHGNLLQAEAFSTYRVPNSQHFFMPKYRSAYLKQTKEIFLKTNKDFMKGVGIHWCIQLVLCSCLLFMQQTQFREHIEPVNFTLNEIEQIKSFIKKAN